jgi:hypothetical protein
MTLEVPEVQSNPHANPMGGAVSREVGAAFAKGGRDQLMAATKIQPPEAMNQFGHVSIDNPGHRPGSRADHAPPPTHPVGQPGDSIPADQPKKPGAEGPNAGGEPKPLGPGSKGSGQGDSPVVPPTVPGDGTVPTTPPLPIDTVPPKPVEEKPGSDPPKPVEERPGPVPPKPVEGRPGSDLQLGSGVT